MGKSKNIIMVFSNRLMVLALLLFVSLVGCSGISAPEDVCKKVVLRYINAIVPAYKFGEFDLLLNIADGKALSRVDNAYTAYKNGKGVVMDLELVEIEFLSFIEGTGEDGPTIKVVFNEDVKEWQEILVDEDHKVETRERWRYTWYNYKNWTPASPEYFVEYTIEYNINKIGGKYKVLEIKILDEHLIDTVETGASWADNPNLSMKPH